MGGQAFAHIKSDTPIKVPRLSPETYQQIADHTASRLETLFYHVTIPREAPGKSDYGDIDFLVEGIRSSNEHDVWTVVKTLLGAELHVPRGQSHSFGIKHPHIPEAYVQVDVELSPGNDTADGAELFEWTKFMKGDSDLLQIVGVIHRSLGITCNDRGLHIRVKEVEPYNKKKSMLFLTRDPNKAMDFYGFDKTKYWQGFDSEEDLFEWTTKGRYFYWEAYEERQETSNDRSRLAKRPMFRRFVQEYMPSREKLTAINDKTSKSELSASEANQLSAHKPSRQEVLEEALRMFGKREQYDAIIHEHETKGVEDALWQQIRDALPLEGAALGTTLKGLRRWVMFKDNRPYICEQPLSSKAMVKWTDQISKDAIPDVLAWIAENREQVRELEEQRAHEARKAAMN
ncbi:hypothetical protein N0V90_008868 [Kalmusia sp. IMI 367209]|nr:hypothetical protein N0V90_008868 [Kalmusia sp. IMI 367209]